MNKYFEEAKQHQEEMVARRRDLHRYPEAGWTEFRTAAMVAAELKKLGYEVLLGDEVLDASTMVGLPSAEELRRCQERAIAEGADPELVARMDGGKTGVMGVMKFGRPGKTVGVRFDMDSNEVQEAKDEEHRPAKEGFASIHDGCMHACGHDGHTTVGLEVARLVAAHKDEMAGTFKIVFQPAEEGVRGAMAMAAKGIVDDCDYFFGGHLGFKAPEDDTLICVTGGMLATTKLDARFIGKAAHAGLAPEEGKNALLAAAEASLALHSIARHGEGASRINVGVLQAGTGRNVIPDTALLKLETRGATTRINDYMVAEARRMIKAAALMYDVEVEITVAGGAPSCVPEMEFGKEMEAIGKEAGIYRKIIPFMDMGGSEDCSYYMERVQQNGGHAVYLGYGTAIAAGHHNNRFDFNENCLWQAAGLLTTLVQRYGNR